MNNKQQGFVPFDLPAKPKPPRLSSSFMSTPRDEWYAAHANKTNPPDGLKFRPKHEFIWSTTPYAHIHKQPKNIGHERILEKNWQHSYICDRITKTMNDKKLKARLEAQEAHAKKNEKTEDEIKAEEELKKLLHVEEKKKEQNKRHAPGTVFTVAYNPKGERITRQSLEKQDLSSKLHRDNWGRFQFEYERIFETDTYHLVMQRDTTDI
jgi:hypothetical protein